MDTKRIREFVKVVELGSITKASRVLNLSQSTLSKHVGELEVEFGVRLLDRLPGGVALTAAGNVLYSGAADLLNRAAQLEAKMLEQRGHPQRRLVVACYVGYDPTDAVVSLAAETMEREAPGVSLDVVDLCHACESCLDMLRAGTVDACLSVMPDAGDFEGLERRPLLVDRLVFVTRGDSALARREGLAVADLAGEVIWVSDERGQPYCDKVRETLGALGLPYALFVKPMAGTAGKDTLNVGHGGLGVALRSMIPRLVPRSKVNALGVIDVADERLCVSVELVWRKGCSDPTARLVEAIANAAQEDV